MLVYGINRLWQASERAVGNILGKKKSRNADKTENFTRTESAAAAIPVYNQRQDWVLFSIAALLVVYPLFFRGLYFPREMFVTHIISSAVFVGFWIIKWKRRDLRFIRTPLDWAVLAFAAAYALS